MPFQDGPWVEMPMFFFAFTTDALDGNGLFLKKVSAGGGVLFSIGVGCGGSAVGDGGVQSFSIRIEEKDYK